MHLLTVDEKLDLKMDGVPTVNLPPDSTVMVEDIIAAQLFIRADGGKMQPVPAEDIGTRRFDPKGEWNGKRILVARSGGFGDLTLLTPVLREVWQRWPNVTIDILCLPQFKSVLENLPYVHGFAEWPMNYEEAKKYDAWVSLENSIEKNPVAQKVHMTDVFAGFFGFGPDDIANKKPEYVVTSREQIWAEEAFPKRKGMKRLGVQFNAQSVARTYPAQRTSEVVTQLHKKGWEIMLMGKPGELQAEAMENFHNLSANRMTFRQSCAIVATCDVVLGPDSALIHVAGALDVPAVALYGPFTPEIRVKYSPSIQVLEGSGHCAPCFHHERRGMQFPSHGPCNQKGYCVVLDNIPVKKVIDRIQLASQRLVTK